MSTHTETPEFLKAELQRAQHLITNVRYSINHGLSETAERQISDYWSEWRAACVATEGDPS